MKKDASAKSRGGPGSRGGGRGGRGGRGGARKNSGDKRAAADDSDFEEKTPASKKAKPELQPRDIPTRKGRGENSTRMDASELHAVRAKRPNGIVAAERAEKLEKLAELERQKQSAIALLASLNAQQDEALAAAAEEAVNHLDDLSDLSDDPMDCEGEDQPIMNVTEEDFDRIEADDETYLDAVPAPPKPAVSLRKKKVEKGATRVQIELATVQQKAESAAKAKALQNKDAAAASKHAGVSQEWKTKATPQTAVKTPADDKAGDVLGGLTDEDAAGARPAANSIKAQENTLVSFVSSDTEETPIAKPTRKPQATTKPKPSTARKGPKIPALDLTASHPTLKSESSASSFPPSTPTNTDSKMLPALVAADWTSSLLPAIQKAVMLHEDPFSLGLAGTDPAALGKDTVAFLQALLDKSYPGNTLVIKWGDVLCTKAIQRIQDFRGGIGKYALKTVTLLFDQDEYFKENPDGTVNRTLRRSQAIATDAKDALHPHGAAFYKTPTPKEYRHLDVKDPGYLKPKGFLESDPIVKTLEWYTKGQEYSVCITKTDEGDVVDLSGLPKGGLALVATAVERAYTAFIDGEPAGAPEFSAANYSSAVAAYMVSVKKMQRSRWESILNAAKRRMTEVVANASAPEEFVSLDGRREDMYVFSSP
ncbi:hypothetical protein FB45DRAFT_1063998 [Roridomyces roridus]|uniref:Uncharacterized protein n=1 Tax=Roridomyces roridus TaxID=1738132 RepID=A0AAD7FG42_9AGAR|nr:hypothetical protein FB45DRAFT_1063998 [Roridomyces roridus]